MNENPPLVFRQKSRMGDKLIVLSENQITVSGDSAKGAFKSVFRLYDIAPNFERIRVRNWKMIQVPLLAACFSAFVLIFLWRYDAFIRTVALIIGGALIAFLLWQALKWIPLVEIFIFRSKTGVVLFDIIGGGQATELDKFTSEIVRRVEDADRRARS